MPERGVTDADLRHGLMTAQIAVWQAHRQTWKLTSTDLDGERLILVVTILGDVLVVTIF